MSSENGVLYVLSILQGQGECSEGLKNTLDVIVKLWLLTDYD